MDKTRLVNLIAEDTGQTKEETEATVKAALKIIRRSLASGEEVRLPDFGRVYISHISYRNEINPQTGAPIDDVRVVRFSPAEAFQKEINHRS